MPASSTDDTDDGERREPEPATCWERFIAEQNPCQDWFLKQHPANDRPIDISASFAPEGCQPLFFKILCTAFVLATAIWSFTEFDEPRGFWYVFVLKQIQGHLFCIKLTQYTSFYYCLGFNLQVRLFDQLGLIVGERLHVLFCINDSVWCATTLQARVVLLCQIHLATLYLCIALWLFKRHFLVALYLGKGCHNHGLVKLGASCHPPLYRLF